MNLHMCAKFGANRPSRLVAFSEFVLRLVRLFAAVRADSRKNTPKNNIYTSKIIIPARTCRHQRTKLTFFKAIFVAFSGTLAEELMIVCRHVRTELYIYIFYFKCVYITFNLFKVCIHASSIEVNYINTILRINRGT